jgi:hypothetical protein
MDGLDHVVFVELALAGLGVYETDSVVVLLAVRAPVVVEGWVAPRFLVGIEVKPGGALDVYTAALRAHVELGATRLLACVRHDVVLLEHSDVLDGFIIVSEPRAFVAALDLVPVEYCPARTSW